MQFEALVQEDQRKKMAPELSVTDYCNMLAERGEVDKLENMNQLAFS
jgi:hypothetical protein